MRLTIAAVIGLLLGFAIDDIMLRSMGTSMSELVANYKKVHTR